MRSTLPRLLATLGFVLAAPLIAQSPDDAKPPAPTTPADLESLAAKVDAAHHLVEPIAPLTRFSAALEFHVMDPNAKAGGQVGLDVRYMQRQRPKRKRIDHLMRYQVKRAGKPIERGRDQFGYWTLVQGVARQVTEAEQEDLAACKRDNHLAQQLVKFLDPGAVLRALTLPTPVASEKLGFGREKPVACEVVEGTLPTFPLLRLAGNDAAVRVKIYVTADEGRLLAALVRPIVDGKVDDRAGEWIRLREYRPSDDGALLVPKVIEHFYHDEKKRRVKQSEVLVTKIDLRPEFALQDFERPK